MGRENYATTQTRPTRTSLGGGKQEDRQAGRQESGKKAEARPAEAEKPTKTGEKQASQTARDYTN